MSLSRASLAIGLCLAAPFALAASPLGTWKGKVTVNMAAMPGMPANMTPQQKAQAMKMIQTATEKMRILITFKPNHTYTSSVTGAPMAQANASSTGKWTQKGNTIMATSNDPRAKGRTNNMTISANGKTMTAMAPNGFGKVVFTR